eukprot:gene7301-5143_t
MPAPRPEFENPPEVYYNAAEARRYTVSTRVRHIQHQMTVRALELMNLPTDETGRRCGALLLDIGCGSGLSGEVLTAHGHAWVGVDISRDMLQLAKVDELAALGVGAGGGSQAPAVQDPTRPDLSHVRWGLDVSSDDEEEESEEEAEGAGGSDVVAAPTMVEVLHNDIGAGLPFRPGTFDGCVSISVLQWLCHSSKRGEVPQRRLKALFQSLYNALRRGAKAVFQFYPSSPEQIDMITKAAMKCGFGGGVVVDFPHSSRAKKHYLVLQAGQVAGAFVPPPALIGDEDESLYGESDEEEEEEEVELGGDGDEGGRRDRVRVGGRDREALKRSRSSHAQRDRKRRRKDNRPAAGTKEWVLMKKEERRRRGLKASEDSKYTMRKRKPRF